MNIPKIKGWEVTTNEKGVEMATLPKEKMIEIVKFLEQISCISEFERLTLRRDFSFHHDYQDGFFIKVSDQGSRPKDSYFVADIDVIAHNKSLIDAINAACIWMDKHN